MYKIIPTPSFKKQIKKLAKKYPQILKDFSEVNENLKQGIFKGDKLQGYFSEIYKIRVGSTDQKKGKSGGFRVVYIVVRLDNIVYLVEIYAKANQENITEEQKQEIKKFIELIKN